MTPEQCAGLINRAKKIVVLTGAGISTAAGIPDFRGPRGLYVTRQYDPNKVFEISAFMREPEYFYQFTRDFVSAVKEIRPTYTHYFLTTLEKLGKLSAVVTQNIDLLHQTAGTTKVIEVHGSYGSARCLSCGEKLNSLTYSWWDQFLDESLSAPVVRCFKCRGCSSRISSFSVKPSTITSEPSRRSVAVICCLSWALPCRLLLHHICPMRPRVIPLSSTRGGSRCRMPVTGTLSTPIWTATFRLSHSM